MSRNPFKDAIRAGETQIGIWSSLCSPVGAEIIAGAGFDWLLLDTEHSPTELASVQPLLQAVARGSAEPIVRVAWNDPVLLKRVLDIGARSVLVPFVQNAKEAQARGFGLPLSAQRHARGRGQHPRHPIWAGQGVFSAGRG